MKAKTVDKIAIISALCCALHCTVLPVVVGLSTWAGMAIFVENPWVEYAFIVSGILLAYFSLGKSLKEHKNHSPARMAIIGVIILLVSRMHIFHDFELFLTVSGALFLIVAHAKNIQITYKLRKKRLDVS